MIDKNEGEKKKLQALANEGALRETYTFPDIDGSVDSYYIHRSEGEEYIQEYGFSTANELRIKLESLWEKEPQMEQVIKVVIAAALKNKPDLDDEENSEMDLDKCREEKLPAYIYNF